MPGSESQSTSSDLRSSAKDRTRDLELLSQIRLDKRRCLRLAICLGVKPPITTLPSGRCPSCGPGLSALVVVVVVGLVVVVDLWRHSSSSSASSARLFKKIGRASER